MIRGTSTTLLLSRAFLFVNQRVGEPHLTQAWCLAFLWFLFSFTWPADAGCEPTQILLVVVAVDSQGSSGRKPPLAFADCAGLPADAGGYDGGGGEGFVFLSPAHSATATDEHMLYDKSSNVGEQKSPALP